MTSSAPGEIEDRTFSVRGCLATFRPELCLYLRDDTSCFRLRWGDGRWWGAGWEIWTSPQLLLTPNFNPKLCDFLVMLAPVWLFQSDNWETGNLNLQTDFIVKKMKFSLEKEMLPVVLWFPHGPIKTYLTHNLAWLRSWTSPGNAGIAEGWKKRKKDILFFSAPFPSIARLSSDLSLFLGSHVLGELGRCWIRGPHYKILCFTLRPSPSPWPSAVLP